MEEKIKRLELEIEQEAKKCEEYFKEEQELKSDCTLFIINDIKNRMIKEIESFVKTNVDNTNELGLSILSEMKKDMNSLIESIDLLKEDLLNNKSIWILTDDFINNIDFIKDNTLNMIYMKKSEFFGAIIGYIKVQLMKIGDILVKYKYIDSKRKEDTRIYSYNYLTIPENSDLKNKIEQYNNIFSKCLSSKEKLAKLEKELKQTRALFLWEQA